MNRRQRPQTPLVEWCGRFLPHYFSCPPSRMHLWLAGRLETLGRGARLAVLAPRNSAKSTWLSFAWPLFCAVEARESYILLVAETSDQARRYLRSIRRELETNAALKQAYPDAAGADDAWNVDRLALANGVEIEALGTGASVRGRKNAADRPTLVVVDDPQGQRHLTSAAGRMGHWTWFTQDLLNAGSAATNFLVAGTSLHREALVDRLLRAPAGRPGGSRPSNSGRATCGCGRPGKTSTPTWTIITPPATPWPSIAAAATP